MKLIYLFIAFMLIFSIPARAQTTAPDSVLTKAHEACKDRLGVVLGSTPKGVAKYAAGYEDCAVTEPQWEKSQAAKNKKEADDKAAIKAARDAIK